MEKNSLQLPLRHIFITQPFGENYADFYQKLGMRGHNGIDFLAKDGTNCFAAHKGIVQWAGEDSQGGVSVVIWEPEKKFKTIYYHLKDVCVKANTMVKCGDKIGRCNNTGIYTTGDHLHFGLKETDDGGTTINQANGYNGAIDPAPYFPKHWKQPPVFWGYGNIQLGWNKKRKWFIEWESKIFLKSIWKRRPRWIALMAYVYGGWEPEFIHNPLNRWIWMYISKQAYDNGDRPDFKRVYI